MEVVEVGDLIHAIDDEECEEPPEEVDMPELTKAEDVTGKPCCIVYEDCLLKLVSLKVFTATLKMHLYFNQNLTSFGYAKVENSKINK